MKDANPEMPNFLKLLLTLERFGVPFSDKAEVNKTKLWMTTRLRWDSFNVYLDWFVSKGFIRRKKQSKTEVYFMTERGRKALYILGIFIGFIS